MKTLNGKSLLLIASLFLSLNRGYGQWLVDNFNGVSVDAGLWNSILPFGQSAITESDGYLTTTGRGTLTTVAGFSSPLSLSGSVMLNNSFEHFEVTLRSDLTTSTASGLSQYYVLTGIKVGFSADGGQISIQQIDGTNPNPPFLALGSYTFATGQFYDFSITDTGNSVSLAINGIDLLSANTTFSTGSQIGIQSREFNDTSSSLDFVSIQPVPEPSVLALLGLGICSLMGFRKLKRDF